MDQLRVLAVFLVICINLAIYYINASSIGDYNWNISIIFYSISQVGIPLFFMISGALLINKETTILHFLKKRFKRIIIPGIFWVIIFIIIAILLNAPSYFDFIYEIIFANGELSISWFLCTIIACYFFIPVMSAFIRRKGIKGAEYFLILWIIFIILKTIGKYPFFRLDYTYFSGYFGFLVLGYYLMNKDFKKISKNKLMIFSIIIYFLSLISSIILINDFSIINNRFISLSQLNLLVVIQSIAVFLIFKLGSELKDNSTNKIYSFIKDSILGKITISISICSYGMYFLYKLIFQLTHNLNINNSLIGIPILVILTVVIAWLSIYLLSKIPYFKKVNGSHNLREEVVLK